MSYNLPNQIIDASGNLLGVGTNAPEYRLDVRSSGINSQVFGVQGDQGRLLSVDDNLSSGTIFSVSNITGLPSLEVDASGKVNLAEYGTQIIAHKPITIPSYIPINTTNKLYNQSGVLNWGGSQVATSAGSGTPSGVAYYNDYGVLTSDSDFVFSGTGASAKFTASRYGVIDSPSASFVLQLLYNGSEKFRFNYNSFYANPAGAGAGLGTSSNYWGSFFSRNAYLKGHAANYVPLTIDAQPAQSANLTEWKDNAGDVLTFVDNQGNVDISGTLRCNDIGSTTSSLTIHAGGGTSAYFSFNNNLEYVMNAAHFRPNNLSKDLGTNTARWENFYVKNINTSGTTTFYKDVNTQTDVFYSGNSLVMELPNQNFEIRGKDGNQFINFSDAGNNAVNVGASLYPAGNKQTNFGFSTLRWKALYGGNADLETQTASVPTLALRNIGGQTADLTQWQDASSNVLAYVDKDGHAHFPSLSVSGDFTYVNSENVTIFDKQIELASLSGSAVSGDALVDEGGFVLKSTDGDKQFIWRDQEDAWTSNQNITLDNKNLYIYTSGINTNSHERLTIGSSGDYFLFESRNTNQTISGPYPPGLKFSTGGHVIFDLGYNHLFYLLFAGNNRGYIDKGSVKFNLDYQTHNIYPKTDSTYDLGTNLLYWNRVYARTLEARAAVAQTDNLTEWKDSAGDVLTVVGVDGHMTIGSGESTLYPLDVRNTLGETGNASRGLKISVRENTGTLPERAQFVMQNRTDGKVPLAMHFTASNTLYLQNWGGTSLHINRFQNSDGANVNTYIGNYGNNTAFKQEYGTGYVGINTTDPDYTLHVRGDIHGSGRFIDSDENAGTAGQVLTSTVTGTSWEDLPTTSVSGAPSGVAFFGGDGVLTDVTKLVYASGDDSDNLEHGLHIYDSGAGTANWERAEIGWGRTGGNAPGRFYIGLNEGGTGSNSKDIRIAGRIIDFKTGVSKGSDILKLGTSEIVTYMRVIPAAPNTTADTLGHTTAPYGRLFLGDRDGSLRFNNDTFIHRPSSGVMVVTSGTNYENAVFRAGSFEAEGVHADVVPLQVKGATGQSVDFAEFKDSTDEVRAAVDTDGRFVSHCTTNSNNDVWFGHHNPTANNSQARINALNTLFRAGSHGVNISDNSAYGGVAVSVYQTFGFSSTAITTPSFGTVDAGIARNAKGHIEIVDGYDYNTRNLGDLTASGVHVSGVHLLPNIPDDRTDVIYNSGGTMIWDGAFAAGTKSFLIDHPTREGMKLQYACLEGPENGAYVRGATTSEIIELPDYWTGLVDEESITVQLTPKSHSQNTYVSGIMNNKVYLISDTDIDVYYNVYGTRKDVAPLEVEW